MNKQKRLDRLEIHRVSSEHEHLNKQHLFQNNKLPRLSPENYVLSEAKDQTPAAENVATSRPRRSNTFNPELSIGEISNDSH
jgi:hypothetical protein